MGPGKTAATGPPDARTRLTDHAWLEQTDNHIHVGFDAPHRVLSSAVLNGGLVEAGHLVNLWVSGADDCEHPPERTLAAYCADAGWTGTCVGMMTAAPLDSLRVARESAQGIDVVVLVTCGLSNARRAGDAAEHREMTATPTETGTINTIVLTTAVLTPAAMVEALMIATEGKSAALQQADVKSLVSGAVATGTGTDATVVVGGPGPRTVCYAGKHVLFGEIVGRLVCDAVTGSIS